MSSNHSSYDGLINLLNSLDKVRETGSGQFVACCPAHEDKSPSLSIRSLSDGRVLLHCFAGCETEHVLSAIGMTFSDLMPANLGNFKRVSKPFYANDVLLILANESLLVYLYAVEINKGNVLTEAEKQRLLLAVSRIRYARSMSSV